jgi:SAM-dependent methyltransferase
MPPIPSADAPEVYQEDEVGEREFKGNVRHLEMSRYIDLDIYHAVEETHPFYLEMIQELHRVMTDLGAGKEAMSVWEFGAGTGLATRELLKYSNLAVEALDLDSECCDILRREMGDAVTVVQGDAVKHRRQPLYDLALSVFAHDHIPYALGTALAANIRGNLKPGGHYLMGGEILPFFASEDERCESLYRYHGFIVEKALRDEHFEVAQIEINALKSGLYSIGDFKRHERQFEEEMNSSGLLLKEKIKIGPAERSDVGGVFVYVYQAP